MRIHRYVIRKDAGSAPNYEPPAVTLAVCKPRVRKKATVGDLVVAFAGKTLNAHEPHTVVWAGLVSEKFTFADYWRDPRFEAKKPAGSKNPDNFYMPCGEGLLQVENPVHGPDQMNRDTRGEYVLVFSTAWRFGGSGPILPVDFGLRITGGRRGERVSDPSPREAERILEWLTETQSACSAGK